LAIAEAIEENVDSRELQESDDAKIQNIAEPQQPTTDEAKAGVADSIAEKEVESQESDGAKSQSMVEPHAEKAESGFTEAVAPSMSHILNDNLFIAKVSDIRIFDRTIKPLKTQKALQKIKSWFANSWRAAGTANTGILKIVILDADAELDKEFARSKYKILITMNDDLHTKEIRSLSQNTSLVQNNDIARVISLDLKANSSVPIAANAEDKAIEQALMKIFYSITYSADFGDLKGVVATIQG